MGEALTNARRHSGARNVWVSAWGSDGRLWIEVRDDGVGFDTSSEAAAMGGTGMKGMRERAALLRGDIEIQSESGAGTRVRVGLTLSTGGEAEASGDLRVLLVEDHAAVREAIAAQFERESGFEVVGQAGSLAEARQMLQDVDVAVVDLGLPDGFGGDGRSRGRRAPG